MGGVKYFFSLLHVSSNFKTKLFKFFLQKSTNTFCFVIANLGRLVAAKMRLNINCIEFAYSRPIVYPRPCLGVMQNCSSPPHPLFATYRYIAQNYLDLPRFLISPAAAFEYQNKNNKKKAKNKT